MLGAAAAAGVPGPVAFCVGRLVALDSGIRFDRICVCFDRELSSSEFATYDFKCSCMHKGPLCSFRNIVRSFSDGTLLGRRGFLVS